MQPKDLSAQQRAGIVVHELVFRRQTIRPMQVARLVGVNLRAAFYILRKLEAVGVIEQDPITHDWRIRERRY